MLKFSMLVIDAVRVVGSIAAIAAFVLLIKLVWEGGFVCG